jgi:hypothetical protein
MDSREGLIVHQESAQAWSGWVFGISVHGFMMGSATIARTRSGELS